MKDISAFEIMVGSLGQQPQPTIMEATMKKVVAYIDATIDYRLKEHGENDCEVVAASAQRRAEALMDLMKEVGPRCLICSQREGECICGQEGEITHGKE